MKPGYKTVINERSFKYATLTDKAGNDILDKYLPSHLDKQELLEERSGHGPFSSRLDSKHIDIAMFKQYLSNKDEESVRIKYDESIKSTTGLMIIDYFKWLKETKGIGMNDEIVILPFEHAANGGIRINERAETKVKGIYAAGEVTGGMHGADRIGGLSTANAMVFGKTAGKEAAIYATQQEHKTNQQLVEVAMTKMFSNPGSTTPLQPDNIIKEIKDIMWSNGCIIRDEQSLIQAINRIKQLEDECHKNYYINDNHHIRKAIRVYHFIQLSMALLNAMLLRKESRGSHYRADYPHKDNQYDKYLVISKNQEDDLRYEWCTP